MIARPDAAQLAALPSRRWGTLVPVLRTALHALPDGSATTAVRRLRAAPASQLSGGRTRADLCRLVAEDDAVWRAVAEALDPLPESLAWLADGWPGAAGGGDAAGGDRRDTGGADRVAALEQELQRARERARDAARERDEVRRRLEGADARAATATRRVAELEADGARLRGEVAELRGRLEAAVGDRQRGEDREARRADRERARLADELSAVRRARDEAVRERDAALARAERAERAGPVGSVAPRPADPVPRLRPGRPSRLPDGVVHGTTEAARLLLHPGRLVLVDGYNVTLRHRDHVDLEAQRTWLVRTLATFVARVPIRPVVVFDGAAAAARGVPPARGVEVRFTPEGVIADDEIVLAVEATDEPVVVVTDDTELRARVAALGADVVPTANLLGVVA